MRRVAVLAASGRELAPARAALETLERRRCGSLWGEVGQAGGVEVHLIKTGMGPAAAAAAAHSVLSDMVLDAVVSTGYAGAVGPAGIGAVILGTEILNWTTDHAQASFSSDPALLAIAREAADSARVPWSQGAVATVEHVVWRAEAGWRIGVRELGKLGSYAAMQRRCREKTIGAVFFPPSSPAP